MSNLVTEGIEMDFPNLAKLDFGTKIISGSFLSKLPHQMFSISGNSINFILEIKDFSNEELYWIDTFIEDGPEILEAWKHHIKSINVKEKAF